VLKDENQVTGSEKELKWMARSGETRITSLPNAES